MYILYDNTYVQGWLEGYVVGVVGKDFFAKSFTF